MKIFVTGGAGYIASQTCKVLHKAGHAVTVYDNLSTGFRGLVKWGDFIEGDLLDKKKLTNALQSIRPAGLIHFAAFSQVGESVTNPAKYIRNNVGGTLSLLEAMRDAGVSRIVVSSTASVYGIPTQLPLTEDLATVPINPYGQTKTFMEWMLEDFAHACGFSWTALRYFNAAGADPEGECGECHDPETHLIPRALMAITGELHNFQIMGEDYPTPDGTCIRDYIHVVDLASAHLAAIERLCAENKPGEGLPINLGTAHGVSVREIVEAVHKVTGRELPYTIGSRRAGDPPMLIADSSRAGELLHWQATHSDVEEIVRDAWQWHISTERKKIRT